MHGSYLHNAVNNPTICRLNIIVDMYDDGSAVLEEIIGIAWLVGDRLNLPCCTCGKMCSADC